jgi:hypothetical protein
MVNEMSIGVLRWSRWVLVTLFILFVFEGCMQIREPSSAEVLGKTQAEVMKKFGQPNSEKQIDTVLLNPAEHSQAEIDEWRNKTVQHILVYGNTEVEINVGGKVVNVKTVK